MKYEQGWSINRKKHAAIAQGSPEAFLSKKRNYFVNLALGLALALLAACGWLSYRSMTETSESDRWETHTYAVMLELDQLLSAMKDAETGQRGFIITGEASYLEPYNNALSQIDQRLASLRSLTKDNPRQQERLKALAPIIQARLAVLQSGIQVRSTQGLEAASQVLTRGKGKTLMNDIRRRIAEAQAEEARLLKERALAKETDIRRTLQVVFLGGFLGLAILLASVILLKRQFSKRQQAEQAMRASEVRYRRIFETAHDGVLLLDRATRKITDANPFITQLLGYAKGELMGKELWQIGLFKDTKANQEPFEALLEKGFVRYDDLPLASKTGEPRDVEFVSNIYEQNGQPVIQCNIRDITERKQVEAIQSQFRAIFESAPGLYLVLKPQEYEIVGASDAYLLATKTERNEILGKKFFEIFPDDPADPKADGVRNLRASLERVKTCRSRDVMAVQHYPIRRPEAQGGGFEERWWSPINSPVLGPDGQLAYLLHRIEDVTAYLASKPEAGGAAESLVKLEGRMRMEAEIVMRGQELQRANEQLRQGEELLQAVNRELDDFATIVSHDLKAPLRAVSTLAGWVQSDYAAKLDEEGRENLAEMVRRVGRMDRMIEGILHYSRLGRTEEKLERVALAELVPTVVQDLAPPPQAQVRIAPDLPVVHGEPVRLRQLFQNLIGNAIKYGDKPQVDIRIEWADSGGTWQFSVSDNGPGIEERHFERIFKIFQTLAPKDKTDSTGVGLALVKRIVERAGGRVWLESRVGEGSTFHFTWPKGRRRTQREAEVAWSASLPSKEQGCDL